MLISFTSHSMIYSGLDSKTLLFVNPGYLPKWNRENDKITERSSE